MLHFRVPPLFAGVLAFSACVQEKALKDEDNKNPILACGTNLHTDDATCKNGVLDPGEFCLAPSGSLPLGTHMHRYENLTLADFNGDGHVDVRVGSDIYPGNGDGTLAETRMIPGGSTQARDCVPGDFNGDGITDLAFVQYAVNIFNDPNLDDDRMDVWVWHGNLKLDPLELTSYNDAWMYPVRVFTGDFNNDGFDDLVVPSVSWDLLECDPHFILRKGDVFVRDDTHILGASGGKDCWKLLVHDFNGDGFLDVDTSYQSLWMGNGKPGFTQKSSEPRPGTWATHGFDLNCDKVPDAVDRSLESVRVWQGTGDAQFALVNPTLSPGETLVTLAELNGDEELDLLVVGPSGLRTLFGDEEFTFSAPLALSTDSTYTEVRSADLNEDGANDLVALGSAGVDIFLSHL